MPNITRIVRGNTVYLRYYLPLAPSNPVSLSTGIQANAPDVESLIQPFIEQTVDSQKAKLRQWLDHNAHNPMAQHRKAMLRYILRHYPDIYRERNLS